MEHHDRSSHFDQHVYLVVGAQEPLAVHDAAEPVVALVRDERQGPMARVALLHRVGVDGLHVGVGGELQSIHIVQFFSHAGVGSLVLLNKHLTALVKALHFYLLQLLRS